MCDKKCDRGKSRERNFNGYIISSESIIQIIFSIPYEDLISNAIIFDIPNVLRLTQLIFFSSENSTSGTFTLRSERTNVRSPPAWFAVSSTETGRVFGYLTAACFLNIVPSVGFKNARRRNSPTAGSDRCDVCINRKRSNRYRIALRIVSEKLTGINTAANESKSSLLDEYLRSDETDFKDVIGMTVDTLLAGIDTVLPRALNASYAN